MSRVRIHVPNPGLAAIPPSLIRNPQRALALAEGAWVYVDFMGSQTSKRSRLSLLFCFSGAAEARRREIIRRFLDRTFRGKAGFAGAAHGIDDAVSAEAGRGDAGIRAGDGRDAARGRAADRAA